MCVQCSLGRVLANEGWGQWPGFGGGVWSVPGEGQARPCHGAMGVCFISTGPAKWLSLGLCFPQGRVLGVLSGLFVMEAGVRFSPVSLLLNSEVF